MNYCTGCGALITFNKYQKAFMLLHGNLIIYCPHCQTKMEFQLMHHVVKISSKTVDKTELWKRG